MLGHVEGLLVGFVHVLGHGQLGHPEVGDSQMSVAVH